MGNVFENLPKLPKLIGRMVIIDYAALIAVIIYSIITGNLSIFAIGIIGIPIIYFLQRLGAG
ncbi:MAG: hypothetical protein ACP5NK_00760 [Thermoplasmata archaeon]